MKLTKRDIFNALTLLAIIAILIYVVVRTTLFLFAAYTPIEKLFAIMLIFGEFFVLLHALSYVFNIFKVFREQKTATEEQQVKIGKGLRNEPSVAILVAERHEPKDVLKSTFVTINAMNYKNKQVYLLDDSSLEEYKKEADELAEEFELKLFRRQARRGQKPALSMIALKP